MMYLEWASSDDVPRIPFHLLLLMGVKELAKGPKFIEHALPIKLRDEFFRLCSLAVRLALVRYICALRVGNIYAYRSPINFITCKGDENDGHHGIS